MAKTYEDLINTIQQIATAAGSQETKAQKKLFKIYEKLKPYVEQYNEGIQDLRLENASVDDKKNLIMNEKGEYTFTKEATREFNKQSKELFHKEFEFKVINVVNPAGLEPYNFLEGWTEGISFSPAEEDPETNI